MNLYDFMFILDVDFNNLSQYDIHALLYWVL